MPAYMSTGRTEPSGPPLPARCSPAATRRRCLADSSDRRREAYRPLVIPLMGTDDRGRTGEELCCGVFEEGIGKRAISERVANAMLCEMRRRCSDQIVDCVGRV